MQALRQAPVSSAKRGRPAVAEPRNSVAATVLTQAEYDGLIQLSRAGGLSISDLMRDLISEAIIARRLRFGRASA